MLPLSRAYVENKIVTKSIFCGCSSLSAAAECIYVHLLLHFNIVSLILACTKEKRNNVFHEGHLVQRRPCKVLPADTCLPDIHHCLSGSSQYLYLIADTAWTILSFRRTNRLQAKSNNCAKRMYNFREAQLQVQFRTQSQEYWRM